MSEWTGIQQSTGHPKSFAPLDPTIFPSQLLWLAITIGFFISSSGRSFPLQGSNALDRKRNRRDRSRSPYSLTGIPFSCRQRSEWARP
jgi:hypothetical protein